MCACDARYREEIKVNMYLHLVYHDHPKLQLTSSQSWGNPFLSLGPHNNSVVPCLFFRDFLTVATISAIHTLGDPISPIILLTS